MKMIYLTPVLVGLVDWLLICGTDKLFAARSNRISAFLAACMGAVQAALCLMGGFSFLKTWTWRVMLLLAAGLIAFEMDIRQTMVYCLINLALGGLLECLGSGNVFAIIASSLLILAVLYFCMPGRPGMRKYIPVRIPTDNGTVSMTALVDTGNSLRDPVSGGPALVVSAQIGSKLLDTAPDVFARPTESILKLPGMRLIPYTTVGGKGLLLAKKYRNVCVGEKIQDVLVAFSPMEIGRGKGFHALTGGTLV